MIKLEITQSSNKNQIGTYTFLKNNIYVGSNSDAEILNKDNAILKNHLYIEVIKQELIVHQHKESEFILINGKRTVNFKSVKRGDSIKLDQLEFKVIDFEEEASKTSSLEEELMKIQSSHPNLNRLIKELNKKRNHERAI